MYLGISGNTVDNTLPFGQIVNNACVAISDPFWPAVAYAIAWRETIYGQTQGWWDAQTVISKDGGHGLFQLTTSFPDNWAEPSANAVYALQNFLVPAVKYWAPKGFASWSLVKLVAASFNAGIGGAEKGHNVGNCDAFTTGADYGSAVVRVAQELLAHKPPSSPT